VIYPENIGSHVAIANLVRTSIWLLLLIHLILFYRIGMNGFSKSFLFMLAIIPARNLLIGSFDYYCLAVLLLLVLYLIDTSHAWLAFGSIIFIAGVLAMAKFSGYIMALSCILLLAVVRSGWPRRLIQRRDRDLSLATLAILPLAFLLHSHSLTALSNYV